MKKPTTIIQKIDFLNMGCYPGTVLFSYQFSYEELMTQLEKNYKKKIWKTEDGLEVWKFGIEGDESKLTEGSYYALHRVIQKKGHTTKNLYYIILKKKFEFTDWDYCMLAHECLHICQYFLPSILDRDKEHEAEAYLHSHLMEQCLKIIRTCL